MMMNRERIGFWVRLLSIVLAAFFIGSFIFVGLGTNLNYNLFDLIGGSNQQQGGQTTGPQEQIKQAEKQLRENPKDREKQRKVLYAKSADAYAAAAKIEPKNQDTYLLAGQAYDQAGEPAQAIKYYNGYLNLVPKGKQADAVKERISSLLRGGETTGGV